MAIKFNQTKGTAAKTKVETYEYKEGENTVRLVGDILARYVYWVPGSNGKDLPIECLGFDREKERFTNIEQDWVPKYFPTNKEGKPNRCQWSYVMNCIDPKDGKVKPIMLKKKLLADIMNAAEQLGLDPTDPDQGFDIIFKKEKTGPLAFNVEYKLQQLKLKTRSLNDAERAALAEAKPIDEFYPRPTPDEIKALLDKVSSGADEEAASGTDQEAVADL